MHSVLSRTVEFLRVFFFFFPSLVPGPPAAGLGSWPGGPPHDAGGAGGPDGAPGCGGGAVAAGAGRGAGGVALRCVERQREARAGHAGEVHPALLGLAARARAEKERRQQHMDSRFRCPSPRYGCVPPATPLPWYVLRTPSHPQVPPFPGMPCTHHTPFPLNKKPPPPKLKPTGR